MKTKIFPHSNMKHYFLLLFIILIPLLSRAQNDTSPGRFGVVLTSKLNGEVYAPRLINSYYWLKGKNQVELGLGFHPFIEKEQNITSAELNYKFFPNGSDNKFNMYLLTSLDYVYNRKETYYPATYTYLFLNTGYGFRTMATQHISVGTSVTAGCFTSSKRSENPYSGYFGSYDLFESLGMNLAFQLDVGYQF